MKVAHILNKFNFKKSHLNSARLIMTSGEQRRSLDEFEDDFDPDLDISKGRDKVWLVKLPKWLMEHWAKADQDNVELAKIKIPYAYPSFTRNFADSSRTNGQVFYILLGLGLSLAHYRTSSSFFRIIQQMPTSRKSSP